MHPYYVTTRRCTCQQLLCLPASRSFARPFCRPQNCQRMDRAKLAPLLMVAWTAIGPHRSLVAFAEDTKLAEIHELEEQSKDLGSESHAGIREPPFMLKPHRKSGAGKHAGRAGGSAQQQPGTRFLGPRESARHNWDARKSTPRTDKVIRFSAQSAVGCSSLVRPSSNFELRTNLTCFTGFMVTDV